MRDLGLLLNEPKKEPSSPVFEPSGKHPQKRETNSHQLFSWVTEIVFRVYVGAKWNLSLSVVCTWQTNRSRT